MNASERPVRVMLVDDHPIVTMGLRMLLGSATDMEIVGVAVDGLDAVEKSELLKLDVIVMDVMMPRLDGIEACRTIMENLPETRVLMLTASNEKDAVIEAVAAGATGYLQKYSGTEDVGEAIRAVAGGGLRITDEAMKRTLALVRDGLWEQVRRGSGVLTPRERELLALFAKGEPYVRIADVKGISPITVRNTIARLQDKLALDNKQELVVWAVRNGLVDALEEDGGLHAELQQG